MLVTGMLAAVLVSPMTMVPSTQSTTDVAATDA
jgi:hypothetical protein